MLQEFTSATDLVRPFPNASEVFGDPLEMHSKHLLPLVTVHSSLVFDDVDIWIPFVTSIEPLMELTLGIFTREHHDFYNQESRFALQFKDDRWTFTGDWNYFAYESGVIFESFSDYYEEAEIRADYQQRIAACELARSEFLKTGEFPGVSIGGEPIPGNWGKMDPRNQNGKPFRYVGTLPGYRYFEGVADAMLVFFDPEECLFSSILKNVSCAITRTGHRLGVCQPNSPAANAASMPDRPAR